MDDKNFIVVYERPYFSKTLERAVVPKRYFETVAKNRDDAAEKFKTQFNGIHHMGLRILAIYQETFQ